MALSSLLPIRRLSISSLPRAVSKRQPAPSCTRGIGEGQSLAPTRRVTCASPARTSRWASSYERTKRSQLLRSATSSPDETSCRASGPRMASMAVLSAVFTASTRAVTAASGEGKRCCLTPAAKVDRVQARMSPRPMLVTIQELTREADGIGGVRLMTASPCLEPRRRAAAVPVALTGPGRSEPEADSAEPLWPADGRERSRVGARYEGRERAERWSVGSHDRVHRGHEHHRRSRSPETFRAPGAVRATAQVTGEQSPRVAHSRAEPALAQDEPALERLDETARPAAALVPGAREQPNLAALGPDQSVPAAIVRAPRAVIRFARAALGPDRRASALHWSAAPVLDPRVPALCVPALRVPARFARGRAPATPYPPVSARPRAAGWTHHDSRHLSGERHCAPRRTGCPPRARPSPARARHAAPPHSPPR